MDRLNQFKKKRFEFGSVEARVTRACEIEKRRKQQRAKDIAKNRFCTLIDEQLTKVIPSPEETQSKNVLVNNRMKQLLKWQAEKELKKKIEALNKKPPFVVGIPHHKPWSALTNNTEVIDCQHRKNNKTKLTIPKRITRATTQRLAEKEKLMKSDTLLKCKVETPKKKKKKCNEECITMFPSIEHHVFHAPKGIVPVRMLDIKSFSTDKEIQTSTDSIQSSFVNNNNAKKQTNTVNSNEDINYTDKNQNENSVFGKSYSDVKLLKDKNKNHENIRRSVLSLEKDINILIQSSVPAALSPFVTMKRGKSNIRDEQRERLGLNSPRNIIPTKNNITGILNASTSESPKTAQYYKYLLNQETNRLHNLCKNWKKIQENPETTDDGRNIINQAIGQTFLLINKKFKRFDGLVSDCIRGNKELLVTCRDLQGFWDMMSMEISNCHSRFEKLEILRANAWVEDQPDVKKEVKIKKKTIKKNKIIGKSNMRAFIEATRRQKINDQEVDLEFEHIMCLRSQDHIRASVGKQNPMKTPESKLDNSVSYIKSDQTSKKGILKYKNETKQCNEFNKSTVKVNFNEVSIYDSTSPNRITEKNKNEASLNIVKTCNIDKSNNMNGNIVEKSNSCYASDNTSELITQNNKTKLLFQKKSRSGCDDIISSSRILRSHSQFGHNNIMNTVLDKVNNPREQRIQLIPFLSKKLNKKLNHESIKENDSPSTPHQRRSTRKSIKLNYSGDCTACTSISH